MPRPHGQSTSDELVESAWPAARPVRPRKAVQLLMHRLRTQLGTVATVSYGAGGYALEAADGELDVAVFSARVRHGRHAVARGDLHMAGRLLEHALDLWRGPAVLPEFRVIDAPRNPDAGTGGRSLTSRGDEIDRNAG